METWPSSDHSWKLGQWHLLTTCKSDLKGWFLISDFLGYWCYLTNNIWMYVSTCHIVQQWSILRLGNSLFFPLDEIHSFICETGGPVSMDLNGPSKGLGNDKLLNVIWRKIINLLIDDFMMHACQTCFHKFNEESPLLIWRPKLVPFVNLQPQGFECVVSN